MIVAKAVRLATKFGVTIVQQQGNIVTPAL
jgi:hypothetical protein